MPSHSFSTFHKKIKGKCKDKCSSRKIPQAHLAYNFAKKTLKNKIRRSGIDYFQHAVELAETVTEMETDCPTVCAALLHDTLIFTKPNALKKAGISPQVIEIVKSAHHLRLINPRNRRIDLEKILTVISDNIRGWFIRIAHQLNEVRNLDRYSANTAQKIAQESLLLYSTIAGRLSMNRIRKEIEDTCFKQLYPKIHRRITKLYKKTAEADHTCLQKVTRTLQRLLKKENIEFHLQSRLKGIYSTYRKIALKKRKYDNILDRLAIRIIVPEIKNCYQVLGILHQHFIPISGRLKDYIGIPKPNGYEAIHTVIYPHRGINIYPIEIQIRTEAMHQQAEFGIAAHWNYKARQKIADSVYHQVNTLKNLLILKSEYNTPQEFIKSIRNYFSGKYIIVFNNESKILHLPQKATALDAAFIIYGDHAFKTDKIKINGRYKPFESPLFEGDTIEITKSKKITFQKSWLDKVETKFVKQIITDYLLSCSIIGNKHRKKCTPREVKAIAENRIPEKLKMAPK